MAQIIVTVEANDEPEAQKVADWLADNLRELRDRGILVPDEVADHDRYVIRIVTAIKEAA